MKFIIMAPSYNSKSGGCIALHKLCHLLNELGEEAYIHPNMKNYNCEIKRRYKKLRILLGRSIITNPDFNSPVINRVSSDDIVIYPEIVSGNPLKGSKVVRWFLHHPGFHTGKVNYNSGELYFSYGPFGLNFNIYGSKTSKNPLRVTHFFSEYYYENKFSEERSGTAYCLRKGKKKDIVHDLSDSILIDDMTHKEIGDVFRRVKYFVSYDTHTMYSTYAIMCGCVPIVIPDPGVDEDNWLPSREDRLGIAYGFENIKKAALERNQVIEIIDKMSETSLENVMNFVKETSLFFDRKSR